MFRALLLMLAVASALFAGKPALAQGFAPPVLAVPTANQPVFVATADVNGDGVPDLIYIDNGATPTASTTHVMLGDGKGGFAQSAVLQTAGAAVAVGKLLGTGHVDIGWLTRSQKEGGVVISWQIAGGVGDGTFSAPVTGGFTGTGEVPALPIFTFMKVANQNGQANTVPSIVAVDTENGYLFAFPIEPTGLESTSAPLPHGPGPLTLGDLNGDTYDDFVVDGLTGFTAQTYLGAPSGSGTGFTEISNEFFSGSTGVHSLLLADFNGDHILDIAVEGASDRIDVFPGNGDGTFSSTSIGGTPTTDTSAADGGQLIAAADVNGDGILDLLACNQYGVSVLLGSASGNYTLGGDYTAGAGVHSQFATADFNQDGRLDIAMDAPNGIAILYGQAEAASSSTVSASPEPSAFEAGFTLTANLPAGTSGTVNFSVDQTAIGTATVQNGIATLAVPAFDQNNRAAAPYSGTPFLPGSHTITADYFASPNALATQITGTHTVALGATSVTLTPIPPQTSLVTTVPYGTAINGYVNFNVVDPAYPVTGTWSQLSNGVAVPGCIDLPATSASECPYGYPQLLPVGSYSFVETYNGDAINAASASAAYAFSITQDTTTAVNLVSSDNPAFVGTPVTFTATLAGNAATPTGTVQFLDGGTLIGTGTLNASGVATFTTATLAVGTHTITVSYAATQNFGAAVSMPLQQIITNAPLASAVVLTSSINPSAPGQPVTFTAAVSVPGPFANLIQSGTVTFLDGTTVLGTGAIDGLGLATFTTSNLTPGSHAITASYPGSQGGAPNPPLPRSASPSATTSAPIAASVSAVLTQVVEYPLTALPPGFTLTVTPNPVSVPIGGSATLLVTVTPISGFNAPVSLSCSSLPYETTCSFGASTILAGGGSTTLELATTPPHACGDPAQPYFKRGDTSAQATPACGAGRPQSAPVVATKRRIPALGFGLPALAAILLLWPRRFTRRMSPTRNALLSVILLAGLAALSACSNCADLGTVPGSYSLKVTGTAGDTIEPVAKATGLGATQSVVVSLKVQN